MSPREQLSVRRHRDRGIYRLTPTGELDIATVPVLERVFWSVCADAAVETIVLDLSELGFIDSSGLHLLLRMSAACQETDRLRVVNRSAPVARLFEISGVRDRLPIAGHDDPRASLARQPEAPGIAKCAAPR